MSRLPTSASGIQPPRRLSRHTPTTKALPTPTSATAKPVSDPQQQLQDRRKQQILPAICTPSLSCASISSLDDIESPSWSARLSLSSTGSVQTAATSPRSSLASPQPTKQSSVAQIGERVAVDSMNIVGTLRFLGTTQFKEGIWAGIQLDIAGDGKNDGSVQGIRYFSCPPRSGLFVQGDKIRALSDTVASATDVPAPPPPRRSSYHQGPLQAPVTRRRPQTHQQHRTIYGSPTDPLRSSPPPISPTEDDHELLERILGEAIQQAPDEETLHIQQLLQRIEVLETENRCLKLENTQNRSADPILDCPVLLANGDFSFETHQAVVKEIKDQHDAERKAWENAKSATDLALETLEGRVRELEAEQAELIKDRDALSTQLSAAKTDKSKLEHEITLLEQHVTLLEQRVQLADETVAEAAKAATAKRPPLTANFYSDDPEEMRERQMQMEMDIEEAHDEVAMIMEQMRSKDAFLRTLTSEVEMHRNAAEEREREVCRFKADAEHHAREKERLKDEVKNLEDKWNEHQDCPTRSEHDKLKRQLVTAKHSFAHESSETGECRRRIEDLEKDVDELQKAGMESIEMYESAVKLHQVDMEAIKADLDNERRKVNALESNLERLKTAGLEATETYESTLDIVKSELVKSSEIDNHKLQGLQETIARLKHEIGCIVDTKNQFEESKEISGIWENERKRLVDEINVLSKERVSIEDLRTESNRLREQLKQADKVSKENVTLRELAKQLQDNYEEQLRARTTYLEDLLSARENQKKTENELRRLAEAKEKTERELATTADRLRRAESVLEDVQKHSPDTDLLVNERKQHKKEIRVLRKEKEKVDAQNTMVTRQMESIDLEHKTDRRWKKQLAALRVDNGKLTQEYDALMESNKRVRTEYTKLMNDMNRLHSDTDTSTVVDTNRADRQDSRKSRQQAYVLNRELATNSKRTKETTLKEAHTHEQEELRRLRDEVTRLRQVLSEQKTDDDDMSSSTISTGSDDDEYDMQSSFQNSMLNEYATEGHSLID